MSAAGHLLKPGEVVPFNGLLFEIDRVERRRVMRVRLVLPAEDEKSDEVVDGARAAS